MQKYFVYLLLIFTFSLRFVVPVFAGFHHANTDQQEEKSPEEKCDPKLAAFEVEVTDHITIQPGTLTPCLRLFSISNMQDLFLPVQYFAIPTPPPWTHC